MTRLVRYHPRTQTWTGLRPFFDLDLFPHSLSQAYPGDNLAVDLVETEHNFVIRTDLPGLKPEDIQVSADEGVLTIQTRQEVEANRRTGSWRIHEERRNLWQRSLCLPEELIYDRAQADLRDGLLTITIPKQPEGGHFLRRIKLNLPKLQLPGLGKKENQVKIRHK